MFAVQVANILYFLDIKTKSEGKYIDVNIDNQNTCRIWTRIYNPDAPQDKLPLIMIHGMGSGMALFAMNLDELSESRTVYTIDLPGYARSSRCKFHSKPEQNEDQFVLAIENWRKTLGLEKICLLGHSFGGYLSSAYALKYPDHVNHLILADPWGFPEMPKEPRTSRFPWWVKLLYHGIFKHLNPLAGIRLAGPWGQNTIARLRPDLIEKFSPLFENDEDNKRIITGYIFHCNAHNPSGEAAFHNLMQGNRLQGKTDLFYFLVIFNALFYFSIKVQHLPKIQCLLDSKIFLLMFH